MLVVINGALLLLNIVPLVGTLLALVLGTYFTLMILGVEFLGKLGTGGMGTVHLAYDQDLNRRVALKVIKDRLAW